MLSRTATPSIWSLPPPTPEIISMVLDTNRPLVPTNMAMDTNTIVPVNMSFRALTVLERTMVFSVTDCPCYIAVGEK